MRPATETTIAFAGGGRITAVHGLAAAAAPGRTISHVASRSTATAEARARDLGAQPATYDELPAGADVVFVTSPPAHHALAAMSALQAGAGVIVEKPLTTTLADADRLVGAAEAGGWVGYAENLAFAPIVRAARARIGTIGPLQHLDVRVLHARPDWGDFLTAGWGGGVLFDLGVHPLAVVLLLAAPARPVAVRARLEGAPDIEVDDHAEVVLTFAHPDGTRFDAQLTVSWRQPHDEGVWDLQAASPTGVLRIELLPHLDLEVDGEPVALPPERTDLPSPLLERMGYVGQLDDLLADHRAGRQPEMGAPFARDVLDVVCAAYASAGHEGTPEPLPFAGDRTRTPLQLWRA